MKILLFDIETAPNLGYIWGKYEQNVIRYTKEGYMLCFAYKWLGEKTTKAYSLQDFPLYKKDKGNDKELVKKLWELFDEADIVVAHNGDHFDIRKANGYFIKAGLKPPSPYRTVDTKKQARRAFMFNSNKLDDIGDYLGIGRKMDTGGFELWEGCMAGDKDCWAKMVKYNKQDVILLENVYNRLLPWMKHPDIGFTGECPNCSSCNLQRRGFAMTRKTSKQRFQCQDCGAWSQEVIKK